MAGGLSLEVAKELAVNETSPAIDRAKLDWDTRGGEVVNAELQAEWGALSMADLRERFRTQPGELRGYLTVVPETRWVKNPAHMEISTPRRSATTRSTWTTWPRSSGPPAP